MSSDKNDKLNHEHEHECECGHDHDHECDCEHEHDHECGCGHDHHHQHTVAITFEDGTELDCPILDVFEANGQEYIALLHPVEETVMIYHFFDNEDGTIELTSIEDDAEYDEVYNALMALFDEEE